MARCRRAFAAVSILAGLATAPAVAQEPDSVVEELTGLDLEELGSIRITSVSRRPESIAQATAAVTVISRDEILRSGAGTLPELLRMVPGLQVAQTSARSWSITARGLAETNPNKFLVLVDGRVIYSPLFAGVLWEIQDLPLDNLDRVEVIVGPGAALWGSNAVNGVINVTTRSARQSLGGRVMLRAGTNDRLRGTGEYTMPLGASGGIRVYGLYDHRGPSHRADGSRGLDDWRQVQAGFRMDFGHDGPRAVTLQGDIYTGTGDERVTVFDVGPATVNTFPSTLDQNGFNLLGRYVRRLGASSEFEFQAYFDRAWRRIAPISGTVLVHTFDVEARYRAAIGARHNITTSAGFRTVTDTIDGTFTLTLDPHRNTTRLLTAHVQDEIALAQDRWYLTVGGKVERNEFSGLEFQPNLRLRWSLNPNQTLWGAVSRAVRIPARIDTDLRVVTGVIPGTPETVIEVVGSDDFDSEELIAWEMGYRARFSPEVSADLSLYYHDYTRLRSLRPLPPRADTAGYTAAPLVLANDGEGRSLGGTAVLNWQPHHRVFFRASYTRLDIEGRPDEGAPQGTVFIPDPGLNPAHMARLRASFSLPRGVQLDLGARFVSDLPGGGIDEYIEADGRLGWTPSPALTLALVGRNLLADRHAEFPGAVQAFIQRSAALQVEWVF